MLIAKVENDKVIEIADYRAMFPNVSFPGTISIEFMKDNDVMGVTVWKPHTITQKLVSCTPYIEDGQVFTIRVENKTSDEIKADTDSLAAKVRADRNQRLSVTDWRFRTDMNPSQAWADYCQTLRDITDQAGFPWEVNWPEQPK